MHPEADDADTTEQTEAVQGRPISIVVCRTSARRPGALPASTHAMPHARLHAASIEQCTSEVLERLGRERPDAEFLLLIDHPAEAIASVPADGHATDAAAALRGWCQSAVRMQRHLRRHRRRTLVLDASDLAVPNRELPADLLQARPWLVTALHLATDLGAEPEVPADPLVAMLSHRAAELDSTASDLHCELLAACEPLGDEQQLPPVAGPPDITAEGLLSAIDTLRSMRDELASLRPHAQALQARLDASVAAAHAGSMALEDSRTQCQNLAADLRRVEAESGVLLGQLHTTQEKLEELFLEQRSIAAEKLVAQTALELQSDRVQVAETERAQALERLAETERELEGLRQKCLDFERIQQASNAREAQLSSESQALLLQLHQTQEEFESNWLRARQTQSDLERACADTKVLRGQLAEAESRVGVAVKARAEADLRAHAAGQAMTKAQSDAERRVSAALNAQAEAESRARSAEHALAQARSDAEAKVRAATQTRVEAELRAGTALQGQAEAESRARSTEQAIAQARTDAEAQVRATAQARSEAAAARDSLALAHVEARKRFEAATAESQRLRQELMASREAVTFAQQQAERALAACRSERRAAQEEALGHFLRLKSYEDSSPGALMTLSTNVPNAVVDLGRVVIGAAHDVGEHRHVEFELVGAKTPRGNEGTYRLRLVEHIGRPGLAILRKDGEPELLGTWQTHGTEDDVAFCLLIPGDTRCEALWRRLGASDWRFVVALAAHLEAAVAEAPLPAAAHWRAVVRSLRMQLRQLPARLRYDGVEVFGDTSGDGQAAVRIEFRNTIFGMRELGTVVLCWRPTAGYSSDPSIAAVACLNDPSRGIGAPPLATWPVAADGTWAPAVSLPVGPGMSRSIRRHLWAAMPIGDRQFVMALLDAMPAASEHPDSAPPTVPPHTATVGRAARDLHKQARRTVLGLELRRNLRGLLRR